MTIYIGIYIQNVKWPIKQVRHGTLVTIIFICLAWTALYLAVVLSSYLFNVSLICLYVYQSLRCLHEVPLRSLMSPTFPWLPWCPRHFPDFPVVPGRHNDRVRRLQDEEEEEEFTVFSAHDTRFSASSVRLYNRRVHRLVNDVCLHECGWNIFRAFAVGWYKIISK